MILDYPDRPRVITKVLTTGDTVGSESEILEDSVLLALQREEGARSQGLHAVPRSKGKGVDSPREPPAGTGPLHSLVLAHKTHFRLLTRRAVR